MKELLKEIKEVENKLSDLKQKATEYSDGYKYVAELFCFGSRTEYTFKNEYAAQQLCNDYYGDNGIVHVYTTNPDHSISNQGGDVTYIRPEVIDLLSTTVPDDYHDSGSNSHFDTRNLMSFFKGGNIEDCFQEEMYKEWEQDEDDFYQ